MKERYIRWYTRHLSREFEMLIFGYAGFPLILFPSSRGRFFQTKDHGLISSAAHLIDAGRLKIYCPDGIDDMSWYNYSIHPADRVRTHNGYENVIVKDVIEFAIRETGTRRVGAAGCGFGGYHAANLALRYPDKVGSLVTIGARFDIKRHIFGYYDDNCYFNNPPDYLPDLTDSWYLNRIRKMGIILSAGEYDPNRDETIRLSNILASKEISHTLDIPPRMGHDWSCWKEIFPMYLSQINEIRYR